MHIEVFSEQRVCGDWLRCFSALFVTHDEAHKSAICFATAAAPLNKLPDCAAERENYVRFGAPSCLHINNEKRQNCLLKNWIFHDWVNNFHLVFHLLQNELLVLDESVILARNVWQHYETHTQMHFHCCCKERSPQGTGKLNVSLLSRCWKGICVRPIQAALANNWKIIDQQMCIWRLA